MSLWNGCNARCSPMYVWHQCDTWAGRSLDMKILVQLYFLNRRTSAWSSRGAVIIKFHKLCIFSFGVCILFRSLANTCPWNSVLCQGGHPIQGRSFESLSWEYFAPVWPGRLCAPPDGRDKEIFKCQVNGGFWTGPLSFFQISTYMLKFNSKTHNS